MPNHERSALPPRPLAVIVGAGGMAIAIARRMAQTHRILLASRTFAKTKRHADDLCEEGFSVEAAKCDVTNAVEVGHLASRVAALGSASTLVHVVGLSPSMGDFRTIMTTNLIGAALMASAMVDQLKPGGAGIFISSVASRRSTAGQALLTVLDHPLAPDFLDLLEAVITGELTPSLAYRHSKAALNRMCEREAGNWARRGLRLLSISPGMIASPMGAKETASSATKSAELARIPLGREGGMSEVADAVEFLASDRARYITGTDLLVDGGLLAMRQHG